MSASTRDAIDFQVSASADYLDGRPFGFVAALDVMGSWPPRQDLHLEMDGSFAAYYAWLRFQTGEVDTTMMLRAREDLGGRTGARAQPPARSLLSGAARPSPDPHRRAAGERLPGADRSDTDADFAAVAARNRTAGARNPDNQVREAATADEMRRTPWVVEPLRRGYLPPVDESATCLVMATEGKAEQLCERPAWIRGVDHRSRAAMDGHARPVAQRRRRPQPRSRRSRWPGSAARATSISSSCSPRIPPRS